MRLYTNTQVMPKDLYTDIINYFFNLCDKVNIYFPNEASEELLAFKKEFLSTTHICEQEDELAHLEPKEGFTMIIASLSPEVKNLLSNLNMSYHISFGLIADTNVIFYIGNDDECVIEMEDGDKLLSNPLFKTFSQI